MWGWGGIGIMMPEGLYASKMSNIKIGTFNVKGLRNNKKRRKIFQHLHQRQYDIIGLQECHCQDKDEAIWAAEWGGKIVYSHGDSDSRGVMVLFRKKAPITVTNLEKDKCGRRIICEVQFEEYRFKLMNLYAPNRDDPDFYMESLLKLTEFEDKGMNNKIIMGDLNLVLDIDKDKKGGKTVTHHKSVNVLKAYMDEENIVDVWRYKNPEATDMTWGILKPTPIFERLDYILVSCNLVEFVKNEGISPSFMSDHAIPWICLTPSREKKGRGFWRLNVSLLSDKGYIAEIENTIKEAMNEKLDTMPKWEWLKHKIRENSIRFSSVKNKSRNNKLLLYEHKLIKYKKLLVECCTGESGEIVRNTEKSNIMNQKDILAQIEKIEKDREEVIDYKVRGAMRRAQRDWLNYGEKPTSYYFNLENRNYKRKNRFSIRSEGKLIQGIRNVLDEQFKFYKELYAEDNKEWVGNNFIRFTDQLVRPTVEKIDKDMLDAEFAMEEMKTAIFQSKREKVPGSDGICIEFYQYFFKHLSALLLRVCRTIAMNGLHTTAKQGVISLIEKSNKDLTKLTHWRPLSLLNCDGKIYAKMLTIRLEKVLPYLIHADQSGFLKNRSISDNLMDLLSVMDYAEQRQLEILIISFDFEKAFDKVNWEYLDNVLSFFDFGPKFRHMVQMAHRDTVSCTVNGGYSSQYINIERGLRQGSPLSPGLFDLAVETLGLAIRQNPKIVGVNVGKYHKKHAQYADDLWAAIAATQQSYDALLETFETFAEISGLKINYDKSQILRIGSIQNSDIKLHSKKPLEWSRKIKILGMTIMANRAEMLKENYDVLIDKMKQALDPWRARSATLIGKIQIVNSLMMSKAVYKLLCLNTPEKKVFDRVRKLVLDFIWDGKKAKIAYKTLTRNVAEGGLNLIDLQKKDTALKMTWIKKCEWSENIWVEIANQLMPAKFEDMAQANISVKDAKKIRNLDTCIIKSVVIAWATCNYHEPKEKGEIMQQKLWMNSHICKCNKPFILEKMKMAGITTIRDIFNDHDLKFYDFDVLQFNFGDIGNYLDYYALLQCIPQRWKEVMKQVEYDEVEFINETQRIICTNKKVSAPIYHKLVGREKNDYDHGKITWQTELKNDWDEAEWSEIRMHGYYLSRSTKLRSFQFKLLSKKLVTNVTRCKWDTEISPKCEFCKESDETLIHLLWECDITKLFWKKLQQWLKYTCKIDVNITVITMITNKFDGKHKEFIDTVILITKQYVYACKCLQEKPNVVTVAERIFRMYIAEKAIALQSNKMIKFEKKWKEYSEAIM